MIFRADLHCHSNASDGSCTPLEILHLAKEKGLSGLSITDHDTIQAYTPELFEVAKNLDIQLITGVEFSCRHKEVNVHILGYNFSLESEALNALCDRHAMRRKKRNLEILGKLTRFGMPIREEELYQLGHEKRVIGRPHIAEIMLKKGYVSNFKEAFNRYIGDLRPCYSPGPIFPPEETLVTLHQAGGKAFIAHPHIIKRRKIIRDLLAMDFDGLEGYYSLLPTTFEKKWIDTANEKNWLISGGSDFHGDLKPQVYLGCSWVDKEKFDKIIS